MIDRLAPGVFGYSVESDGALYVPFIMAEKEGSGAVGKFLDELPTDRTVKVPNVESARLKGMLERRGFAPEMEWAEEFGEHVEVYVRKSQVAVS